MGWRRVAAVAFIAAAVAWLVFWQPAPGPLPTPAVAGEAAQPPGTMASAAPARAPSASAWPAIATPQLPASAPVWDLCGVGRLPVPAGTRLSAGSGDLVDLPAHLGAEPAVMAMLRTLAVLDTGEARARAAAVLLRGTDASGAERAPALAALSAASIDPLVAMWAAERCQRAQGCDDAALAVWRSREPDNAAAWLLWLQRHPQRRAEALQGLAGATRFSVHADALLAAFMAAQPADTPAYLEPALWSYAIGVEAARTVPQYQLASALCKPPLAPGSEVHAVCQRLAEVMTEQADTDLARHIGARIGERVGWPADRVAQALERARAGQTQPAWLDAAQPLSCASVNTLRSALQARARAALRLAAPPGGAAPPQPPPASPRPCARSCRARAPPSPTASSLTTCR